MKEKFDIIWNFIKFIFKKIYGNYLVLKDEIHHELANVTDKWDRSLESFYKSIGSFFKEVFGAFTSEEKLSRYFDHTGTTKYNMRFDIFIIVLIFISSFVFILRSYDFSGSVMKVLLVIDAIIIFIFTIEFFLRNLFAKNRSKYFFSIYNIIDIIAILPFWFGFSALHFLRALRILKIFRFFPKYFSNKKTSKKILNRIILFKAFSTFFVFVFVFSSLIYYAEHIYNKGIYYFHDAVYFVLVTVTTVGFGDITPVTSEGRMIVIFMIVLGVFLFPVYISSLIRYYMGMKNSKQVTCVMCGLKNHDENAIYCKMCGTSIYQEYHDSKH